MTRLPRITVITPSFNQGKFIKQTIDSVLSQNYPNLEYWVMDGGSTDETVKILKSYGKRIHWVSEKDKGQSHAINKGMKRATGEIVCYLNSDDYFLPGALNTVGQSFANNQDALWVTGDYIIVDATGKTIQSLIAQYKQLLRKLKLRWLLYIANYIVQPSTFWRAAVFKETGLFDQNLRYCMDYDFWLKLQKKSSPIIIDEPLSAFRIHSQSKGGSQYTKQFAEEEVVARKYTDNFLLTTLHKLHSTATVLAYKLIK